MAESEAPSQGRIFISYRRQDTAYPAGWLYERLVDRYAGQVFKDVDSIELGDDFVEVITAAVASCDVLLAHIGDEWVTIADEDGRRRLDDPMISFPQLFRVGERSRRHAHQAGGGRHIDGRFS
jgi:hypothetical protein